MPMYDLSCARCGAVKTEYYSYEEFSRRRASIEAAESDDGSAFRERSRRVREQVLAGLDDLLATYNIELPESAVPEAISFACHFGLHHCDDHGMGQFVPVIGVPPIHYKGYGFFKTDNASLEEKYARDHFDGSGTNAEMKAMERRIKDPQSTVPGAQVASQ